MLDIYKVAYELVCKLVTETYLTNDQFIEIACNLIDGGYMNHITSYDIGIYMKDLIKMAVKMPDTAYLVSESWVNHYNFDPNIDICSVSNVFNRVYGNQIIAHIMGYMHYNCDYGKYICMRQYYENLILKILDKPECEIHSNYLVIALSNRLYGVANRILDTNPEYCNDISYGGTTIEVSLVCCAVIFSEEHHTLVNRLISLCNSDIVGHIGDDGFNALYYAIRCAYYDIAMRLLDTGSYNRSICPFLDSGWTILHVMAQKINDDIYMKNYDMINTIYDTLVKYNDINYMDSYGVTPLMVAMQLKHNMIAIKMIEAPDIRLDIELTLDKLFIGNTKCSYVIYGFKCYSHPDIGNAIYRRCPECVNYVLASGHKVYVDPDKDELVCIVGPDDVYVKKLNDETNNANNIDSINIAVN